jgi:hypothetical protein
MAITTDKEQEEIDGLKIGFNKVLESKDYNYMASRRLDISRTVAKKLMKITIVINLISIVLIVVSFVMFYLRPAPEFYASAPSGKVYYIKKLKVD